MINQRGSNKGYLARFYVILTQPVSSASLAVFRILFGCVLLYSLTRFALSGWVEELWLKPQMHLKYAFAPWAKVYHPLQVWMQLGLAWLGVLGLTLGLFWRASLLVFIFNFIYLQLIDLSNYLNHYYLVVCLSWVLLWMPAGASYSIDAVRRPQQASSMIPLWCVWLLRFQVGVVYFFAAIAKIQPEWLFHAQPLSIWLSARADTPILGSLMGMIFEDGMRSSTLAYLMSWLGMLYDLSIVGWLLWSKSRPFAYIVVLGFHSLTWLLFDIGIFPLVMTCATTIFFTPSWPIKVLSRFTSSTIRSENSQNSSFVLSKSTLGILGLWVVFQMIFPLRAFFYQGDVLWSEQGMRYSWRVMVREKMGSITYRVHRPHDGRVWEVNPLRYLEPRQLSELSGQPDMIAQLARHIYHDFAQRGLGEVEVFAQAMVSLNGRPPQLMMNPLIDLAHSSNESEWTLPAPQSLPLSSHSFLPSSALSAPPPQ